MRTAVAETSIAAFYSLSPKHDLQPREREILELFEAGHARGRPVRLSRQQLARTLGWQINQVCGRVNSLVTKKALIEDGERRDPITGKPQKLLGLAVFAQAELEL